MQPGGDGVALLRHEVVVDGLADRNVVGLGGVRPEIDVDDQGAAAAVDGELRFVLDGGREVDVVGEDVDAEQAVAGDAASLNAEHLRVGGTVKDAGRDISGGSRPLGRAGAREREVERQELEGGFDVKRRQPIYGGLADAGDADRGDLRDGERGVGADRGRADAGQADRRHPVDGESGVGAYGGGPDAGDVDRRAHDEVGGSANRGLADSGDVDAPNHGQSRIAAYRGRADPAVDRMDAGADLERERAVREGRGRFRRQQLGVGQVV